MYTRYRFAPEGVSAEGYTLEETAILNERYAALIIQYNALRFYPQIDYDNAIFADKLQFSFPELMQIPLLSFNKQSYDGVQCLLPCTTHKCKYRFRRSRDLITAVYIPVDIERVKLRVRSLGDVDHEHAYNDAYMIIGNEFVLDAQLISDNKTIDELLEECKLAPAQSEVNIDSLLETSRNIPRNEGYIHDGHAEFITIGGEEYRRVLLMEPFIPMCAFQYGIMELIFNRNTTFYAEVVTLENDMRKTIMQTNSVLYTPYSSDPVIVLENGRLFNHGMRSVNNEWSYENAEELPHDGNINNTVQQPFASSILLPELKYIGKDDSEVTILHTPIRPTLCARTPVTLNDDAAEEVEVNVKMNDE